VGIANMGDIKKLGRIGLKTLIYFEVLSTIAFIVGMLVSNLSQIGYMLDLSKLSQVDISTYVK
ncbi:MAG TPA: glutamate/aspartate:proton symporter GltP, partial [Lactobacillus sp.]|nr:glutamate/aspartate:proton symporter GltP [Lactobacillus sp.]